MRSYGHLDLELHFFLVYISADGDSNLVAHLNLDFFAYWDGLDYAVWRRIYVAQWAQGHSNKKYSSQVEASRVVRKRRLITVHLPL